MVVSPKLFSHATNGRSVLYANVFVHDCRVNGGNVCFAYCKLLSVAKVHIVPDDNKVYKVQTLPLRKRQRSV